MIITGIGNDFSCSQGKDCYIEQKIKNFYASQITTRKVKGQEATGWKDLYAVDRTKEVLLHKIDKDLF